jgi:hypothetical protein
LSHACLLLKEEKVALNRLIIAPVLKVFYGCYDRVRAGKIYQPATLLQAPVGVDYSIGKARMLGLKLGVNCFEYSTAGHYSTGKKCLQMVALLLQKKGA